jgi:hypothetical protein
VPVEFLGFKIIQDRIEMAKDKFESIKEMQAPRSIRDIQSCLGLQISTRDLL